MSNKFNHVSNNNLSSGSSNIVGATLAAANLVAGKALKTNGLKQLYSTDLDIEDVNGLASALAGIPGALADTDELAEGSTNLYYTDARVDSHTAVTEHAAHVDIIAGEDPHGTLNGINITDTGSVSHIKPIVGTYDMEIKTSAGESGIIMEQTGQFTTQSTGITRHVVPDNTAGAWGAGNSGSNVISLDTTTGSRKVDITGALDVSGDLAGGGLSVIDDGTFVRITTDAVSREIEIGGLEIDASGSNIKLLPVDLADGLQFRNGPNTASCVMAVNGNTVFSSENVMNFITTPHIDSGDPINTEGKMRMKINPNLNAAFIIQGNGLGGIGDSTQYIKIDTDAGSEEVILKGAPVTIETALTCDSTVDITGALNGLLITDTGTQHNIIAGVGNDFVLRNQANDVKITLDDTAKIVTIGTQVDATQFTTSAFGSASAPAYSFTFQSDCGMCLQGGTHEVCIISEGKEIAQFGDETGVDGLYLTQGNITMNEALATVDGRDVSADGTTLDNHVGITNGEDPHGTLKDSIIVSKGGTDSLVTPFDADYRLLLQTKEANSTIALDPSYGGAPLNGSCTITTDDRQIYDTGANNPDAWAVCSGATTYLNLDTSTSAGRLTVSSADVTMCCDLTLSGAINGLNISDTGTQHDIISGLGNDLVLRNQANDVKITLDDDAKIVTIGTANGMNLTTGNITLTEALATVDGRDVSADGDVLDNLTITLGLDDLTAGEVTQLQNINTTTVSATQWGYLGGSNQALKTTDSPTFVNVSADSYDGVDLIDDSGNTRSLICPTNAAYDLALQTFTGTASVHLDYAAGNIRLISAGTTNSAVKDNQAAAWSVNAIGGSPILQVDTTDTAEKVVITGTLHATSIDSDSFLSSTGETGTVAIGLLANGTSSGIDSVSIGNYAGGDRTGINCVAIGKNAGKNVNEASTGCVAIGTAAGATQASNAVAIGTGAGLSTQQTSAVAIGNGSGSSTQGSFSVAVGYNAGATNLGSNSCAIGSSSVCSGASAVALGKEANTGANTDSIAIGHLATCDATNQMTIGGVTTGKITEIRPGSTDSTCNLGSATNKFGTLFVNDITLEASPVITVGTEGGHLLVESGDSSNLIGGPGAGDSITSGLNGVYIGENAGTAVTSTIENVMIGKDAGHLTNASYNTFVGSLTHTNAGTSTSNCVAVGYRAGGNVGANYNIAIGVQALGRPSGTKTGASNTAVGFQSMSLMQNGVGTTSLGYQSGFGMSDTIPGNYGTFLGYKSGFLSKKATYNTFVGGGSGGIMATGEYNTMLGGNSDGKNDGDYQISLGFEATCTASNQMTIGSSNVGNGEQITELVPGANDECTLGSTGRRFKTVYCSGIDTNSGLVDGVDLSTIAVGQAFSNPVDDSNMIVGTTAGDTLSGTAGDNICIGKNAGTSLGSNAQANTIIGSLAGTLATGDQNVLLGHSAGLVLSTGDGNVLLGRSLATALTTGGSNVIIGNAGGALLTTGDRNVAIGAATILEPTADYQIAIGYQAKCTKANQCTIGGLNTTLSIDEMVPGVDNEASLGSSTLQWTDLYKTGHAITAVNAVLTADPAPLATPITRFNTTAGVITCTMPAAGSNQGKSYLICLETYASTLSIARDGTDTIDGGTSALTLTAAGKSVRLTAVGTNWYLN